MENSSEIENLAESDICSQCMICLENLHDRRRRIFKTTCGHFFHQTCFSCLPLHSHCYRSLKNPEIENIYQHFFKYWVQCPCCRAWAKPTRTQLCAHYRERIRVEKEFFKQKKNQRDRAVAETKLVIQSLKNKIKQEKENLKLIQDGFLRDIHGYKLVLQSWQLKL